MKRMFLLLAIVLLFSVAIGIEAATPKQFGLQEGDLISAEGDPDIYIINQYGYKRLFLNPLIFSFYGHLGGFSNVKTVTPSVRDAFETSLLFQNCESGDPKVYAVEVTEEDSGMLHWLNISGDEAVGQDPLFFQKIFCINNNEFEWYELSYTHPHINHIRPYYYYRDPLSEPVVIEKGTIPVSFEVNVPAYTPQSDIIYVDLNMERIGSYSLKLYKQAPGKWVRTAKVPAYTKLKYKYNRNNGGFQSDEQFWPDDPNTYRTAQVSNNPLTIRDSVSGWRWIQDPSPSVNLSSYRPTSVPTRSEEFMLGIFLLDWTDPQFFEYMPSTFQKIADDGFLYVGIPYFPATVKSIDPIIIEPGEARYEEDDLIYIKREAEKYGLKLMFWVAVEEAADAPGGDKKHNEEWYGEYAKQRGQWMIEGAKTAEKFGVAVAQFSNFWDFMQYDNVAQKQLVNSELNNVFEQIQKVYSGKITSDFYLDDYFDFYKHMDWIGDKFWEALTSNFSPSISEMKTKVQQLIDEKYQPIYNRFGKPIAFAQVGYSSYDGAAGARQIGLEGPEVGEWFPYNDAYLLDLQEQADAFEAFFQAIYDETIIVSVNAFGFQYWDSQGKGPNFRGKPAEEVWIKWNNILSQ